MIITYNNQKDNNNMNNNGVAIDRSVYTTDANIFCYIGCINISTADMSLKPFDGRPTVA